MNVIPSKVGADPKKIAVLVGLVVIAGYFYFSNSNSGGSSPAPVASRATVTASSAMAPGSIARSTYRVVEQSGASAREFRPTLKPKNVDTASIDPTLRLDLLAKLKTVSVDAGTRSLFEIAAAPPEEIKVKEPAKIAIASARRVYGPMPPQAVVPPPEPRAPPIPLKFYGFVNKTKVGDKRAFFLDGEDIVIASEGDVIKKRYKIVRIGINSAVVEDTEFKSNNQQTLPLVAELAG
ncbi:MAG: hypothetical protein WBE37_26200 [Bryobacteraceae bacterium]